MFLKFLLYEWTSMLGSNYSCQNRDIHWPEPQNCIPGSGEQFTNCWPIIGLMIASKTMETMPNFPTRSEFHPWNEWMEWHNGFTKNRMHSLWRLTEWLGAKHIVIFLSTDYGQRKIKYTFWSNFVFQERTVVTSSKVTNAARSYPYHFVFFFALSLLC